MTDYYPLIARGIAGLGDSNAESRRALYQQVRAALLGHLRAINPPLEEPEILRECLSFDDAVRRVEAETAGREAESLGEVLSRIEAPNLLPGREDLNLTDVRLRRPPRRKGVAIAAKRLTKVLASIAAWYAVFAVIALAFALYWQRDRVKAWFVASPAAQWQHEIASLLPKITDRACSAELVSRFRAERLALRGGSRREAGKTLCRIGDLENRDCIAGRKAAGAYSSREARGPGASHTHDDVAAPEYRRVAVSQPHDRDRVPFARRLLVRGDLQRPGDLERRGEHSRCAARSRHG